ncbi:MAG: NAD(P)-dependent alcohol dehydrogenase [Pseudomonadota bacterium]
MRAWEIVSGGGVDALALNTRDATAPGPGQVQVSLRASSINYRDLTTVEDPIGRKLPLPTIPNSDGAGVVTAVGDDVTEFAVGDRVMSTFFEDWDAGPVTTYAMSTALGGARQGVLAEQFVLDARGVIAIPDYMSFAEAATLPCAALTAWHALTQPHPVVAGDTVLLLGTGGVSVFAQQFCNVMGARSIVTSSSDAKLERMRALGAGETINYAETPDWETEVLNRCAGGVDRVVEVGGPGTLAKSIQAAKVGGVVALIGILTGAAGTVTPTDIMRKSITLRGIYVGPRQMFREMNAALALHEIRPVIDETFRFEDAPDAYRAMRAAQHFGKLVIEV